MKAKMWDVTPAAAARHRLGASDMPGAVVREDMIIGEEILECGRLLKRENLQFLVA